MIWTPRQRRYLNILKHRRMNNSRPVKFQPGTLVKYNGSASKRTYVVDHNSGSDVCWISHRSQNGSPWPVPEDDLRRLTFVKFLWYADPMTGALKIGFNRAIPLLLAVAILVAGSIASFVGVEDGWKWFCPALLVTVITGTLVATYRNYTGKQS